MKDKQKTKTELLEELRESREKSAELERELAMRKQSEQALLASDAQKRAILNGIPSSIAFVNQDLEVQWANQAALDSISKTQSEVLERKCYALWADPEKPCENCPILKTFLTRQSEQTIMHTPDGRVWETAGEPVFDDQGTLIGVMDIATDITKRTLAEEEKSELEEQLRHAMKMEAIGRLAGGVAHDFNNVLCAITGNATLLLDDLSTADPLREKLEEITKAANRATDLTRQLLAFSRKQVIEPKVIDLSQLVENLHSMLTRLISEDIILRTVPRKHPGRVRVDPVQIEQIVLNLAINARDAMPDGGEMLIETADVMLDEDYCKHHAKATPGAYVMLGVSDTGCGMSDEVREKIFEPFFTTKQLGQGTGLGLATVFGIVEQNGGRIDVQSEPGKGTSFKVYFPLVIDKAETLTHPDAAKPESIGGNEIILVVEDEKMVRTLAVKILQRRGYKVLAGSSGADAIALAAQHDGPIDLLLTDVIMPHMNGRELAKKFAELRPGIKVLYTSGYSQDVIAHQGVLDEDLQFIEKPYSPDSLAARVREVLDRD